MKLNQTRQIEYDGYDWIVEIILVIEAKIVPNDRAIFELLKIESNIFDKLVKMAAFNQEKGNQNKKKWSSYVQSKNNSHIFWQPKIDQKSAKNRPIEEQSWDKHDNKKKYR